MLWACCFVLFCFQTVEREKKSESAMQPAARMFSSFLSQPSSALYKPKRLFSSRVGAPREGRGHLSHLSMYLIVRYLSVYFPHTISSHCAPHPGRRLPDPHNIVLSSSAPHIYNLDLFFNFSQTVVAIRLSPWLDKVVENTRCHN